MASPKADGYAVIQTASGNSGNIRNVMPRYTGTGGVNTQADIQASAHSGLVSAEALVQRMKAKTYYTQLFKEAFGTSDITPERINEALAQYASAASHSTAEELSRDVRFSDPFRGLKCFAIFPLLFQDPIIIHDRQFAGELQRAQYPLCRQ